MKFFFCLHILTNVWWFLQTLLLWVLSCQWEKKESGTTVEQLCIADLPQPSTSSSLHITHEHTKVLDNWTYISIFLPHPNMVYNLNQYSSNFFLIETLCERYIFISTPEITHLLIVMYSVLIHQGTNKTMLVQTQEVVFMTSLWALNTSLKSNAVKLYSEILLTPEKQNQILRILVDIFPFQVAESCKQKEL